MAGDSALHRCAQQDIRRTLSVIRGPADREGDAAYAFHMRTEAEARALARLLQGERHGDRPWPHQRSLQLETDRHLTIATVFVTQPGEWAELAS